MLTGKSAVEFGCNLCLIHFYDFSFFIRDLTLESAVRFMTLLPRLTMKKTAKMEETGTLNLM